MYFVEHSWNIYVLSERPHQRGYRLTSMTLFIDMLEKKGRELIENTAIQQSENGVVGVGVLTTNRL